MEVDQGGAGEPQAVGRRKARVNKFFRLER